MSAPALAAPPPPRRSALRRFVDYLRARPILVLFLLSPGIPEYLSGSSKLALVVVNPVGFLLFLALNAALYLPGVLLIREASVRWRKGWPTILTLGAAYAIVEEGIGLDTMFNPSASVVGTLGSYGHFLGVNTVWLPGVLFVHMIYSISLPILLLGLALPETRGRSLIGASGIRWSSFALVADVTFLGLGLNYFAIHFWMGWPLFVGCLATVALLVLLARRLPARWEAWRTHGPVLSPILSALVGIAFFPSVIVVQGMIETAGLSPVLAIVAAVGIAAGLAAFTYRYLGIPGSERAVLSLALGLLIPIMILGFAANFPIELNLLADAAVVLLFRHLWKISPPLPVRRAPTLLPPVSAA